MLVEKKIILNTAIDFVNHLEYAAVRRLVVELRLREAPDLWQKIFIKKVTANDSQISVLTLNGRTIAGEDILALVPPFDDYDTDVISCLCG
ncbi:MAG: hypothetical protein SF052_08065 [Bacteroidia bacterium]|nr:hypothetical protein [Bacteroidia bacterium]